MSLTNPARAYAPSIRSWLSKALRGKRPCRTVQRLHFVDPFPDKNPFAIQILINVRSGVRIDIESCLPRIDTRQSRACRTLHADPNPGLQDAVARDNNACSRIDNCLIERVRQRPHHTACRPARQFRVGIKSDHKTHPGKNREISNFTGKLSNCPRIRLLRSINFPRLRSQPIHSRSRGL